MQMTTDPEFLGQFIPPHYHYEMLLDEQRVNGFSEAIKYMVPAGGKVIELGGGTGILSFFAAQKAQKVWCIEANPLMAAATALLLEKNGCTTVELVVADAGAWVPPEPIDVVICEMLHSALLREKQIQVIERFKSGYRERFPAERLPRFIPEATYLAVQPVQQDFNFHGYQATVPLFLQPERDQSRTAAVADPIIYELCRYEQPQRSQFAFSGTFSCPSGGGCNALRFITKNILAILLEEKRTIDWHNQYLIMPLAAPISLSAGSELVVNFSYEAGESIESLARSITCSAKRD